MATSRCVIGRRTPGQRAKSIRSCGSARGFRSSGGFPRRPPWASRDGWLRDDHECGPVLTGWASSIAPVTATPPDDPPPGGRRRRQRRIGVGRRRWPVGARPRRPARTGPTAARGRADTEADEVPRSASLTPTERVDPELDRPDRPAGQRRYRRPDGSARAGRPGEAADAAAGLPADGDRHPDLRVAVQGGLHPAGPERLRRRHAGSGWAAALDHRLLQRRGPAVRQPQAGHRRAAVRDVLGGQRRDPVHGVPGASPGTGCGDGRDVPRLHRRSPRPPASCRCRWTSPRTSPSARSSSA